jgi:hypothetical protein
VGEDVACISTGQKVRVIFLGERGLLKGHRYVFTQYVLNADRTMAEVVRTSNFIIQTYQYLDTNTTNMAQGSLLAIDEVLIPNFDLNDFTRRFEVRNYYDLYKGNVFLNEIRFSLEFSEPLAHNQILYIEAPLNLELHDMSMLAAAQGILGVEETGLPCNGFRYGYDGSVFRETHDPLCGCYQVDDDNNPVSPKVRHDFSLMGNLPEGFLE